MSHGVEGNAACAAAGEREDAGVGLYRAVHPAGHQREAGYFLGDHLVDHLEVYLEEHLEVHLEVCLLGYLKGKQTQNTAFIFNPNYTI